jgi:hypothetical protein
MPSQHRYQPISIRPPEHLRDWLLDYAEHQGRAVRSIVVEAIEEYRSRREQEGNDMPAVTSEQARNYLYIAFANTFLRPDKPAQAPIWFPGIEYGTDGTLSDRMKAEATRHLLRVLRDHGYVITLRSGTDVEAALHHVLWDKWTKEEAGNGRFTGRLFGDYGEIYQGDTADDAANHTVERLAVLGGSLCSYSAQDHGSG